MKSYKTNLQTDLFYWKIVLYISNRIISFQSVSVFQITISNSFIFSWLIFIFQFDLYYSNPMFKSVYIFQTHICFLNWYKFFKPTLMTCFLFFKSINIFQILFNFSTKHSNRFLYFKSAHNFQNNLYLLNQLPLFKTTLEKQKWRWKTKPG